LGTLFEKIESGVSDSAYYLRWRGQDSGPVTIERIRQMWRAGQISGAYQVDTERGWILVQDFLVEMEAVDPISVASQNDDSLSEEEASMNFISPSVRSRSEPMGLNNSDSEPMVDRLSLSPELRNMGSNKEDRAHETKEKTYYLNLDGLKKGPFDRDSVHVMINAGKVMPETLVSTEETGEWLPISACSELLPNEAQDSSGDPPFVALRGYAGFSRRFIAFFLDSLILLALLTLILALVGYSLQQLLANGVIPPEKQLSQIEKMAFGVLLAVFLAWWYFAGMEAGTSQATLGKKVVRIKVIGLHGGRISFGRATGRLLCRMISSIFFIGYLMALSTRRRQSLHDILTGCLVVNI
jgi:uncharacterized RDD family membrane protein YckC